VFEYLCSLIFFLLVIIQLFISAWFSDFFPFADIIFAHSVSFGKVWELLAFCSCCFVPSESLVDYLLAYFQGTDFFTFCFIVYESKRAMLLSLNFEIFC
jgi:hypothetical protein